MSAHNICFCGEIRKKRASPLVWSYLYIMKTYLQYNLNGLNTDGSFTIDDSNSFFQSLQNSSNSSRKQIFRDFFLILSCNCMLCVLTRIASSRQF